MKALQGEHIYLRALEPEDVDTIYNIENDEGLWSVGETIAPYSRYVIKEYLANAHKDIYEAQQLRLVIAHRETEAFLGLVDLYSFDPHNLRAGIGILISNASARNKGYGADALKTVINYCKVHLKLHQVYASIEEGNAPSVALFEKVGFTMVGLKKDWRRSQTIDGEQHYINEYLYQYIF